MLKIPIRVYKSSFKKGHGLMFRLKAPSFGVLFPFKKKQKVSIHMMFVFFPLDILWLDERKKVLQIKTLKPFTAHSGEGMYVLEMPAGWARKSRIKPQDELETYISEQRVK